MERDSTFGGEGLSEDDLRAVVMGAARVTEADFAAVVLVDQQHKVCHVFESGAGDERTAVLLRAPELHTALIEEARPMRLSRLTDHPQMQGRDVEVPGIGGFLAVPIRASEQINGSLYLVKSSEGVFTEVDEVLITPFARAAGMAAENAFLRERRQRAREWLVATVDVTRSLLDAAGEEPLTVIGEAIRAVSASDMVLVILPASPDTLMIETAVGDGIDHLAGYAFPRTGSVSDTVLRRGRPVIVDDARGPAGNGALRDLADELDVGPMMFVPLSGKRDTRGVLAVGRRRGGLPFIPRELEPATAFANHAALALELADNRLEHHRLLMIEGRDQLARELHDEILQRLFSMGMSMQAIAGVVEAPHADRLRDLAAATDLVIERVRAVLRELGGLEATYEDLGYSKRGDG